MKRKQEKKLEDLLGSLKDLMKEALDFKPEFKIVVESDEEGEGCHISVEGTAPSLMSGLSVLVDELVHNTNLTKDMIKYAVNLGLEGHKED